MNTNVSTSKRAEGRSDAVALRVAAFAVAALIVGGTTCSLGSYSNVKSTALIVSVSAPAGQAVRATSAPLRVDVVGTRAARTAA